MRQDLTAAGSAHSLDVGSCAEQAVRRNGGRICANLRLAQGQQADSVPVVEDAEQTQGQQERRARGTSRAGAQGSTLRTGTAGSAAGSARLDPRAQGRPPQRPDPRPRGTGRPDPRRLARRG
jgi:hypothetical protein